MKRICGITYFEIVLFTFKEKAFSSFAKKIYEYLKFCQNFYQIITNFLFYIILLFYIFYLFLFLGVFANCLIQTLLLPDFN